LTCGVGCAVTATCRMRRRSWARSTRRTRGGRSRSGPRRNRPPQSGRGDSVRRCARSATKARSGAPCISRRWSHTHRARVSAVRHESAARPTAGSPAPSCESGCGCRLARWSPQASPTLPGPPQPEALSVPGDDGLRLTMTSAVRHPVQRCASTTQSHRSVLASRTRPSWVRCSTCSWCRKASTSSWSSARDRADVRRVRRNETSTDTMARKRIHRRPQHQVLQQERPFH
jgi:hypothetical protein